jgi:catechol 2,3-dioxygenase-like lactoylglutathione lyase family enzyme
MGCSLNSSGNFDHIGFPVRDLATSRAFYVAALAPLGIGLVVDRAEVVAFGRHGRAQFWLGGTSAPPSGVHVSFSAADRASVRAFYEVALAAGGSDNGAPGLRPHYHPNYYGAFVLDPDGHNVEAVCRNPED